MKDYYTPKERLRLIIDSCAGGNQRKFADATGIDEGTVSRMLSNDRVLTEHRIGMIASAYPAVSPQFLRDGISYPGDISVEAVRVKMEKVIAQRDKIIETLQNEIDMQRKVIEKLVK